MIVSTAFTPNGDGRNDMLYLVLFRIKESKYFKVFNRWGKVVFETRMLGLGWDGMEHCKAPCKSQTRS
jgi:gliding motility-associated-like protein